MGEPRVWITSDHHFNHKNIIRHADRPYLDVDQMNRDLIRRWNAVVAPDDVVYHLGDFAWSDPQPFLDQLNGRVLAVLGNHDDRSWAASTYMEDTIEGQRVVFCHYPIESWNGMYKGVIHVHGHTHQPQVNTSRRVGGHEFVRLNACVEATGYGPRSLGWLIRAAANEGQGAVVR
jgi:calcineurin-like phosphoesterase family protein